jgi:hypothetical protein
MDTGAKLVAELEPKPVDYPVPGEVYPVPAVSLIDRDRYPV